MATSNYTPNLHLSAWLDSDRPKRADFVSDNSIIDTQLGGHIADSTIHVTSQEKAKLTEPFIFNVYSGTGESSRTISLSFQPKLVIVFKRGVPFVTCSGSVNNVNAAVGCYGHGCSAGIGISSSGVVVTQDAAASDGVKVCLNESGAQYSIVAFK
ncbi:MAG: hypothetical protein IJH07_00995 [Ruminococcus sp.]|nr:hypothetical protein [Ruminococcus sp.]